MLETLPDTVQPERGSRTENAHETHKDLEIMELRHALLQKELQKENEALRMALKISGRLTRTWFVLTLLLLATLLFILYYLYYYP